MIAAIQKSRIFFWKKLISSIIYFYLGVTSILNVILLCPGLDSLRETVYSFELNLFKAVLIPQQGFIHLVTF